MEKCSSKVRPLPFEKWDNEKFVVRFHIEELPDEDGGVKYEYNEVLVPEVTRKAIIDALVAQVYDFADEIALTFNRDADKEDIEAHEAFVVECKAIADEILGNE